MSSAAVASILRFVRLRSDFTDDVTRIMGDTFDAACRELHDTRQPAIVQEIIAKRIILPRGQAGVM
jgi:hypothetical protein